MTVPRLPGMLWAMNGLAGAVGGKQKLFYYAQYAQIHRRCKGQKVLDLGCGEGGYSRKLAKRGAQLVSVDCSAKAVAYATALANEENLCIEHFVRNGNDLFDIESEQFDLVLCSMMLMDCEDFEGTLREAVRVLKPNGRLFASVLHPCFDGNHESGIGRQGIGVDRQVVVMNYFEPKEWEAPLWGGTIPVI